jgi:uncharacterized protein YacL
MNNFLQYMTVVLLLLVITEVAWLSRPKKRRQMEQISTLVDTSVLMDGRVIDLARTGFLLGQIIVPKSVLSELQLLADGGDHTKRERARHGMDVVKQLQDELGSAFVLLQDQSSVREGVDDRLIALAKETNSSILTLDYNLNKVAQVEGISVLNINELAKALRMTHLPGDTLLLELTQKGQGNDQAVGYLNDGTMVVVEQAKKYIGKTEEIEIIRSLQTDAGKMMFAKRVKKEPVVERQPKREPTSRRPVERAQKSSTKQAEGNQSSMPKSRNSTKSHSQQRPPRPPKAKRVDREAELIRLADSQQ